MIELSFFVTFAVGPVVGIIAGGTHGGWGPLVGAGTGAVVGAIITGFLVGLFNVIEHVRQLRLNLHCGAGRRVAARVIEWFCLAVVLLGPVAVVVVTSVLTGWLLAEPLLPQPR
jgi:hypothetical protein